MRAPALVVAGLLLARTAAAEEAPERLTLDQVIERSFASARADMAARDTEAAEARVDEASAARLPKLTMTAFGAPSPQIDCLDPDCTRTDPEDFEIRLSGIFHGASLQVVQPLYTFGKLTDIRQAARAGAQAQRALEDSLAGDLAVEAARAYWGLKLARELVLMLEDGLVEIDTARDRIVERLAEGSPEVTVQDRLRVETLLAEAKIRLAEARSGEASALAGVRAIVDDEQVDIDEEPLEQVELELTSEEEIVAEARDDRPEVRAADAGARAADELAEFESDQYWPDLAVVGSVGYAYAMGVDDAPSAVYAEPFHQTTGALAIVLRWNLEPWTTRARVDRARATAKKAKSLAELARTGAAYEASVAYADAATARDKVVAAQDGEAVARAWLASVLQADAVGTAETRDLADAYIAWFEMRARLATSIFQWNVATVRLGRATGEFKAASGRR